MQNKTPGRFSLIMVLCLAPVLARGNGDATRGVELQPYEAVYELNKKGMTIAEATFTLKKNGDDGLWTFSSHAEPRGLAAMLTSQTISEFSRFRLSGDGAVKPSSYSIRHSDEERAAEEDLQIQYDWQSGNATIEYRQQTRQIKLDKPLFDPLSEQVALMIDLHNPPKQIDHRVVDGDRAEQHRYTVYREEVVEIPEGTHPSTRLVRNHGKRRTEMWFARDLNFLPVRIRQYKNDKLNSELVLHKLTLQ